MITPPSVKRGTRRCSPFQERGNPAGYSIKKRRGPWAYFVRVFPPGYYLQKGEGFYQLLGRDAKPRPRKSRKEKGFPLKDH